VYHARLRAQLRAPHYSKRSGPLQTLPGRQNGRANQSKRRRRRRHDTCQRREFAWVGQALARRNPHTCHVGPFRIDATAGPSQFSAFGRHGESLEPRSIPGPAPIPAPRWNAEGRGPQSSTQPKKPVDLRTGASGGGSPSAPPGGSSDGKGSISADWTIILWAIAYQGCEPRSKGRQGATAEAEWEFAARGGLEK